MPQGFILQPTYRVEAGQPVVHLYGTLESGASFLVRDTRGVPHFWIHATDAEAARRLGAPSLHDEPRRRTMTGAPVVRVEVSRPADAPPLRDHLIAHGIARLEADVRFAYRYLIERGVRGAITIENGAERRGDGVDVVFENPDVTPGRFVPTLSVLSLDIETDPRASRLLSVALSGCGADDVFLFTGAGQDCPAGATPCASERELLEVFAARVRELDPDILTGWNVVGFDLAVLLRLAERRGVPLVIGRGPEPLRLRTSSTPRSSQQAVLPGRLVLDGIDLLRGAFVRLEDYSLNGASHEILGKTKTITGPNRAFEILRAFERDRAHFVEYNLRDAQLVLEILDELRLVDLCVERSLLTGMPPDRVAASIASFDFLYLTELSRRDIVAPSVRARAGFEAQAGGHVLDPAPGLYRNVIVLDFKSLYPSIMRTFQIDPLGLLPAGHEVADPIVAPNGAAFSRERGILPCLLDDLAPRREAAKAAGDTVASHAIKILMNSCYGVLGTSACRFASPDLANAITGFGKLILLWSRDRIERGGHRVIYGDTDSLFVVSGTDGTAGANALGARLAREITDDLAAYVAGTWRVESRLEAEFERLYLRLLLPQMRGQMRGGTDGARKRYAGLVEDGDERRVEFVGLEAVRRDWTDLARRVQRELYERLFTDRPVAEYLSGVVAELRAGQHDDLLIYRKGLRRRLDSYTATTPPHVAAARKMSRRPGRVVTYVMTRNGPEPADERRSPIDREHYVKKQVRAVAEPVLELLSLDFDRVIGDDRQMRLF